MLQSSESVSPNLKVKAAEVNKTFSLTPIMTYDDLKAYLEDHLPPGLSKRVFRRNACIGVARLVAEMLGGSEKASIFWVEYANDDPDNKLKPELHAYVVKKGDSLDGPAYCCYPNRMRTVGYVMKNGEDLTDKVLSCPWNKLEV